MVWSPRRLFVAFGFLFSRAYAFQAGGHLPVSHLCGRSLQHRLESSSPQQLQDIGSDALRLPLQDLNAQEIEFLNTVKKQIHEVPNLIEKAETSGARLDDFFIWRYMKSHGDLDNTNSVISLISETVEWRLEQLHGFLDNEALALELAEKKMYLEAEGLVNSPKDQLLKGEQPIENETKTVDELGMKNGDILDLQFAEPRATPSSSSGGGGTPPRKASESSGSTAGAASSASFQERLKKRREANAGIAADKPRFDPFPELARSRNVENAGSKGLSLHDIESEENSKFNIKQQEKPHISKVSLGLQCAEAFSAFAGGGGAAGGDPMRCGLLLGRYLNGSQQVRVEAIYEPPQHPRPTAVEYDPQDLALAKPGCREAAEVAAALGMEPVGWVFSCPPRAYELSALDVFTGARLQCEAMGNRALGRERGRAWAMVAAKMTESGEISFEAFQVSDLAVQMSAEGVLIDNDNIAQMVDKIRTTENVIAENRNTREVDCLWFTVPVPIASHPSKLAARFPPAHRKGGRAVQRRDLRRAVFGAGGGGGAEETLESRLSDFHLLMALHNRFENKEDFTKLCQHLSVKKKNHMKLSSKYQIMLEMICGGSH